MKTLLALLALLSLAPAALAQPSAVTVHIKNFKYNPSVITIHAGQRVTFINDDDEAHTVSADDHSFDSAGMDTKDTWQHTFSKPGKYPYFCELHPYMKATVIVLPAKP